MNDLMTPEQRELALRLIESPPFGSALEKAKRWGVDLRELVNNLCLTPTERALKFSKLVNLMLERRRRKQLRKAMRKRRSMHPPGVSTEESL